LERNLPVSAKRPSPSSPSPNFRVILPKILGQLRAATESAQAKSWDEPERGQAGLFAKTVADAFRAEGLHEAATMARSLACLLELSKETIAPIETAFRKKVKEILDFLGEEGRRAEGTG
jgi:hypothetical protein